MSLFREILRRKVLQACGIYLGCAWMFIEASSLILPMFGISDDVFQLIVYAGIAGLPITAGLSWAYDLTGRGLVRDEEVSLEERQAAERVTTFALIGVLVLALSVSLYVNLTSTSTTTLAAHEVKESVPVLVADFENHTGERLFDGTLEDALQIGIEGAPFVTSYLRTDAKRIADSLHSDAVLDASTASLVALREGIHVVLVGSIVSSDAGFELRVAARDPTDGAIQFEATASADSRLEVLQAVDALSEQVRQGLGDPAIEKRAIDQETFTSTSLEAASEYMKGQVLARNWQHADAVKHYAAAVSHDPDFGRAYSGWAYSAWELGETKLANDLWQEMLKTLDTMTERERLRALGIYYANGAGNVTRAIENYEELTERYPADSAGLNNLAVAYFLNREFEKARITSNKLLEIYPDRVLYAGNHALYSMYAGDFQAATKESQRVLKLDHNYYTAWLPIAANALVQHQFNEAQQAYSSMAETGAAGERLAALGRIDLAMLQGDVETAVELLNTQLQNVALPDRVQARLKVWLASLLADQDPDAAQALLTETNLENTQPSLAVPAAQAYIIIKDLDNARNLATQLGARLSASSRAHAQLIKGWIALSEHNPLSARDYALSAIEIMDLWLAHELLGRAYLEAGHAVEAMEEFELCLQRQGEVTAVFLDDKPSIRYLGSIRYWLGRAREVMGQPERALSEYHTYIKSQIELADHAMVLDARQRAESLQQLFAAEA